MGIDLLISSNGLEYTHLYDYYSKRSRMSNDITDLILDFKKQKPEALLKIQKSMIERVASMAPYLRDTLRCCYLVSIPSSRERARNIPCETVCAALDAKFPWLTHIPNALQRINSVQKSAFAYPGERPDYQQHIASIRYAGPSSFHASHKTIILVDDVITRGETSAACRDILMRTTKCERVFGLFAAKTV